MNKEIKYLIRKNLLREIEIELLKKKEQGFIIPEVVFETLKEIEYKDELAKDQVDLDLAEEKDKVNTQKYV